MRTKQGTVFQSLRAVQGFLTEHADKLAGVVQTGAKKRLEDAIAALDTHASTQTGSFIDSQSLTQRQKSLRTVLRRDHMAPVARIARADLPNTPEFRPLRMPRGRITPEKFAAAASGMAQVAARYTDTFTAAGMPADFVDRLDDAADNMLNSLADRTRTRGRRRGATEGLREKLSEGRKVVAILDAFVSTALAGDPSLLADWKIIVRVPKTTGRIVPTDAPPASGSVTPTPSEPAPVPVPAPAPAPAPELAPELASDSHSSTPEA